MAFGYMLLGAVIGIAIYLWLRGVNEDFERAEKRRQEEHERRERLRSDFLKDWKDGSEEDQRNLLAYMSQKIGFDQMAEDLNRFEGVTKWSRAEFERFIGWDLADAYRKALISAGPANIVAAFCKLRDEADTDEKREWLTHVVDELREEALMDEGLRLQPDAPALWEQLDNHLRPPELREPGDPWDSELGRLEREVDELDHYSEEGWEDMWRCWDQERREAEEDG